MTRYVCGGQRAIMWRLFSHLLLHKSQSLNLGSSGPYSNRLYRLSHLTSPVSHLLEAQEAQSPCPTLSQTLCNSDKML